MAKGDNRKTGGYVPAPICHRGTLIRAGRYKFFRRLRTKKAEGDLKQGSSGQTVEEMPSRRSAEVEGAEGRTLERGVKRTKVPD